MVIHVGYCLKITVILTSKMLAIVLSCINIFYFCHLQPERDFYLYDLDNLLLVPYKKPKREIIIS